MIDEVVRGEVFGEERLQEFARGLAVAAAQAAHRTSAFDVTRELRSAAAAIRQACTIIEGAVADDRSITPAARWLIENLHVVEEQLTDLPDALPRRLVRRLPHRAARADGRYTGERSVPRAWVAAMGYIEHSDSRFELARFRAFVNAYQSQEPLLMRELWAMPAILRLVLMTNLAHIATRTAAGLTARRLADAAADRLLADHGVPAGSAFELAPPPTTLRGPYFLQLIERLRHGGPAAFDSMRALEAVLAPEHRNVDEIVRNEHARQSANNVTARNIITSFRDIASGDWRDFFCDTAVVEITLQKVASYCAADVLTRDRYRDSIEELAIRSGRTESEVARELERTLAAAAAEHPHDTRLRDAGFHLVSAGRAGLEKRLGVQPSAMQHLRRALLAHATFTYLGALGLLTLLVLAIAAREGVVMPADTRLPPIWWALCACALLPASELALALLNRSAMALFPARRLPRLALRDGIPAESRTLVVVPVLIANARDVEHHLRQIEVHALANPDEQLRFALLSDWTDAAEEDLPADAPLLAAAWAGIERLNATYPLAAGADARFYLLHRRRRWNAGERSWMGWERKRGKLAELNALLLGRGGTAAFVPGPDGRLAVPQQIRYVVTLDADTRLPYGSVARLVGTASHPLHQPRFAPDGRRVTGGYGVIQPRVVPLLPRRGERTLYRSVVTGASGMDPYAGAVSDVYQDVFGEGIFTGKGIYDVAAFERVMQHRVPDNTLLSHDLLEGLLARCALASDIECYEDFPSHSEVAAARLHRWTRGDWQLLPWLFGRRGADIPLLGRWKMWDNLRRSLLAPAAVATFVLACATPPARPWVWLLLILAPWLVPNAIASLARLAHATRDGGLAVGLRCESATWASDLRNAFVSLSLLAQNAWLMIDAIGRALVRQLVTHRKRLEWVTAAQASALARHGLRHFTWSMKGASIVVVLGAGALMAFYPAGLRDAAPLLLLWWFAPVLARRFSLSADAQALPLATAQRLVRPMRLLARRTWRFFTSWVTADENFLPPDNLQESPREVLAHRTSPTNIGLYLLATASARDLGWLGLRDAIERLQATTRTLAGLEHHRGHLFNWYDTRTRAPLEPRYVSTVDSGNLCGHFVALAQWCRWNLREPPLRPSAITGLGDALGLLRAAAGALPEGRSTSVSVEDLGIEIVRCSALLDEMPGTGLEFANALRNFAHNAVRLGDLSAALGGELGANAAEVAAWAQALREDACSHLRDVELWIPRVPAGLPERWNEACARACDEDGLLGAGLEALPAAARALALEVQQWQQGEDPATQLALGAFARELARVAREAEAAVEALLALAAACDGAVQRMDFKFLFDTQRQLFSIGWRVADSALDPSYYDLLASEARLASFVAIAKGDIPARHWSHLGRRLTGRPAAPLLVSWSGSMFEYLMPALVMREPPEGLLDLTAHRAVDWQVQYAQERGTPWGISEAAYNVRDAELTYQYSAFGVPGMGLKRGLERNLVIAPYATMLAAMYAPEQAVENFTRLADLGATGRFGFYESIDFTRERLPENVDFEIVRAFMAHHQGMSIVALANVIGHVSGEAGMRRHFHADARVMAAELLLEEQAPGPAAQPRTISDARFPARVVEESPELERCITDVMTATPVVQFLSNRRYAVMLSAAGSGYSIWEGLLVTRWREDTTRDPWGSWIYLRDVDDGRVWSATFQPTGVAPDAYDARFAEERASISRRDGRLTSTLEVMVSPEDDAELRRLTLHNADDSVRILEVTSYAEIVLAALAADAAHPAFSNLFVQTEWVHGPHGALIAHRRPRSHEDNVLWAGHVLSGPPAAIDTLQYESDRARFIGRDGDLRAPQSVVDGRPLSNTAGAVLDPVFSLRVRLRLEPGEQCQLVFTTFVAGSRSDALRLAEKFRQRDLFESVAMQAWTYARAGLHHLRVDLAEARVFQVLAGHAVHADHAQRAARNVLGANLRDYTTLWRFGISGDRPIVLMRCTGLEDLDAVRQLLRAQEYWRIKQLIVDVILLNERGQSYEQELQLALEDAVRTAQAWSGQMGGAAPLAQAIAARTLDAADFTLLLTAARVVLVPGLGSLSEQMLRGQPQAASAVAADTAALPGLAPRRELLPQLPAPLPAEAEGGALADLEFFNGFGGFAQDGREYVIGTRGTRRTPQPWSNVIANERFGFLVTEAGSSCTWSQNSRDNQLTPWSNDAVSDPSGEALYLRDEDSGLLWSPTAQPLRLPQVQYLAAHGQGYSRFEAEVGGIASELTMWVDTTESIKWFELSLVNRSNRARTLSLTSYVEWQMGSSRPRNAPFIVTERDAASGAILARNPWNRDFAERVAFVDLQGADAWTGSRREFLGRHGSTAAPLALRTGAALSRRTGAGFDPCAVLQRRFELARGARLRLVVTLGQGADRDDALRLVGLARSGGAAAALAAARSFWSERLEQLQIRTPDRALDLLVNRWLLYQVTACRLWGRTAFYQSGGAFGFRDQLQDVHALATTAPALARAQIVRAAGRQFAPGDVQHWWHPPSGRGVRTRFTDDRLWLPWVAAHYLAATGDHGVLEESCAFLEGAAVPDGREDAYYDPGTSSESATVYEHCARAIDVSLGVGPHGLPLMGGGDWNDGMNRIGLGGKGESVWMSWFLIDVVQRFAPVAESRGDGARARHWRDVARQVAAATESTAWDGAWYRRAYFDDGTPLGTAAASECRIDSIAQSWSVISGAGDPQRMQTAMNSVNEYLVRDADALALLFTPPFDRAPLDPGYIKGYLPGLRENGGQYTHAAVWTLIANAMLGRGAEVAELLEILNPVHRAATRRGSATYKVEPYVISADIYSEAPHAGRGGWTWYTGAAGWLHRAIIEYVLGVRILHDAIEFAPCLPPAWPGCELRYRHAGSDYTIVIENGGTGREIVGLELDGVEISGSRIPRSDDGRPHRVRLRLK